MKTPTLPPRRLTLRARQALEGLYCLLAATALVLLLAWDPFLSFLEEYHIIVGLITAIGLLGLIMAFVAGGWLAWQERQRRHPVQKVPEALRKGSEDQGRFKLLCAQIQHTLICKLALDACVRNATKQQDEAGKKEDVERELPSAGDLREITLQSELSGKAPTLLSIIVSGLLILGISGTMVGVHLHLRQLDLENMQALAPALLPSMVAIFFCVLLLVLRAFYALGVDRYLLALGGWIRRYRAKLQLPAAQKEAIDELDILLDEAQKSLALIHEEGDQWGEMDKRHAGKKAGTSSPSSKRPPKSLVDDFDTLAAKLDTLPRQPRSAMGIQEARRQLRKAAELLTPSP